MSRFEKLKEDIMKDKDRAFNYMLPNETAVVDRKRDEMSFFTNQCWDEVKRVANDNGALMRKNYMEMS